MSTIVASKRGRLPLGYPTTNHALDGGLLDRSLLRQNSLFSRHSLFFLPDSISAYGSICCSLGAPSGQKRLRLNITFFKSAHYSTLLISFFMFCGSKESTANNIALLSGSKKRDCANCVVYPRLSTDCIRRKQNGSLWNFPVYP